MNVKDKSSVPSAFKIIGNFLVVKWLRLHVSSAGGLGSIPGQELELIRGN